MYSFYIWPYWPCGHSINIMRDSSYERTFSSCERLPHFIPFLFHEQTRRIHKICWIFIRAKEDQLWVTIQINSSLYSKHDITHGVYILHKWLFCHMVFSFCHENSSFAAWFRNVFIFFFLCVGKSKGLVKLHDSILVVVLVIWFYNSDSSSADISKSDMKACEISSNDQI